MIFENEFNRIKETAKRFFVENIFQRDRESERERRRKERKPFYPPTSSETREPEFSQRRSLEYTGTNRRLPKGLFTCLGNVSCTNYSRKSIG